MFISAGFIRAPPDMLLRTLREQLAEFLGDELLLDKFSFLKCVGSSLALVKAKQEMELKLKAFAPPYAGQPELYLLPGVESESSLTPATHSFTAGYPESTSTEPLEETHDWDQAILHPTTEISRNRPKTAPEEKERQQRSVRKAQEMTSRIKGLMYQRQRVERDIAAETRSSFVNEAEDAPAKPGTNSDSGISGNFPEHLHGKRDGNLFFVEESESERRPNAQIGKNPFRPLPDPAQYHAPPSPPPLPAFPATMSPPPRGPEPEESLVRRLQKVKDERLKLEKCREDLIRKTKSLLEQYKLRRQQERDSWKKKYFESKKVTSVLEETFSKCRTDLELCYQNLLSQLAARDSRKRIKYPTLAATSKNSVIMSITSRQQEVEQLKRRVEDARIKLLIEMKMRKQAASDLNVLKAQLAKKKAESALTNHVMYRV
uniref:Spermatosis associated 1 n=1 Tax=Leptobrachium leishanense TaxID=445787 RepID=A0A8C5Q874_9ANUR